jgi:hypothetical protein
MKMSWGPWRKKSAWVPRMGPATSLETFKRRAALRPSPSRFLSPPPKKNYPRRLAAHSRATLSLLDAMQRDVRQLTQDAELSVEELMAKYNYQQAMALPPDPAEEEEEEEEEEPRVGGSPRVLLQHQSSPSSQRRCCTALAPSAWQPESQHQWPLDRGGGHDPGRSLVRHCGSVPGLLPHGAAVRCAKHGPAMVHSLQGARRRYLPLPHIPRRLPCTR